MVLCAEVTLDSIWGFMCGEIKAESALQASKHFSPCTISSYPRVEFAVPQKGVMYFQVLILISSVNKCWVLLNEARI